MDRGKVSGASLGLFGSLDRKVRLARHLVEEVLPSSTNKTVCYYFFTVDYGHPHISRAMCCIPHQLYEQRPELLLESVLTTLKSKYEPHFILFSDLFEILIGSVQGQDGEVILVLDGIHKIARYEGEEQVNELVHRFKAASIPSFKILFTSRSCSTTQRSMQALENKRPSTHIRGDDPVPAYQISKDIGTYIRHRPYQLATRRCLLQHEYTFLPGQLTSVPNKTYLWADIRAMVGTVPNIVQREYAELLRWSADYGPAKTIRHMIMAAKRPFSLKELAGALEALGKEHVQIEPMHRFRHSIREICGLLITTTDDVVRHVHPSVRKFLLKQNMTDISPCVKYLHCTYNDTYYHKWDELLAMIPKHPFLQYAVQKWHHHVRLADLNDDNAVHQLVLDLLGRDDDLPYFWFRNNMFDLYTTATTLLQSDDVKPNSRQKFKRSPLSLVAKNSHEDIVQLLLDASRRQSILSRMFKRLRIDAPDTLGRTPLWHAANEGHAAVVRLLLSTGKVNPARGDSGTMDTPGVRSRKWPYQGRIRHCGKADPDHSTGSITPLMAAVTNGHVEVVRLLVETGRVNLAFRDMDEMPLMRATRTGHEEIACILRTAAAKSHSKASTMDPDAQKGKGVLTNTKEVSSDSDEDDTTVFEDDMDPP
ncbi:hypothetical protein BJX62DRAFT_238195 [Aspergillus germanicus]